MEGPAVPSEGVAVHLPCHIAEEMGARVRRKMPGARILVGVGLGPACSGGGGGLLAYDRDSSIQMAEGVLAEAEAAGAETLVTACPFSLEALRAVEGSEIEVRDLCEHVLK